MSLIASLDVLLRGNTSNLDSALDKSSQQLGKFRDKVTKEAEATKSGLSNAFSGLFGGAFGNLLASIPGVSQTIATVKLLGAVFTSTFTMIKSGLEGLGSKIGSVFSGLTSMLGSVGSALGSLASQVASLGIGALATGIGVVVAALTALVAALGATSLALTVLGVARMSAIGETNKLAKELGITTEAMGALQHAGNMSGVENMTMALRHLSKSISEANNGTGEAAKEFKAMGLEAELLARMPLDTAAKRIADSFQKITNEGDRSRIAMELMGRGGSEMINLLSSGSAGLDKFREQAKEMGLLVNQEQADIVSAGNRAWRAMMESVKGVGSTMAVFVAPVVQKLSEAFQWLFTNLNKGVQSALPYVNELWDTVKITFGAIAEITKPVIEVLTECFQAVFKQLSDWGINWQNAKDGFLMALWTMQFSMLNLKDILGTYLDIAQLAFSRFVTNVKNAFTELLPTVFIEFGNFIKNFFENLAKNVANNMDELWKKIKSGGKEGGKFSWINLTDGLDEALKKIKDKTDVPLTDFEKNLEKKIRDATDKMANDWDKFIAGKWAEFMKPKTDAESEDKTKGPQLWKPTGKHAEVAERGSVKAFEIIAGAQGDKMFAVANATLAQLMLNNGLAKQLLEQFKGAKGIAKARF